MKVSREMTNNTTATFKDVSGRGVANSKDSGASTRSGRPILELDWSLYESYLQDSDWSDDQKREFITTIWQIVIMFVDLGFGVESGQLALRDALEGTLPPSYDEPEGGSLPPAPSPATRKEVRE